MKFNNKKLEKTSKFVNYLIASVLALFLIFLSSKVINDIGQWKERPTTKDFEDTVLVDKTKHINKILDDSIKIKIEKKSNIQNTLKIVNNNYSNAKQSYDNWLEARKTIGSPKEDKEILTRANELDTFFQTQQQWNNELANINDQVKKLQEKKSKNQSLIEQEHNRAYKEQQNEIRSYELKVFLIRLAIILPILLLGLFFIFKFRNHKYWPIFLGFILFSFYSFFFGLVPYLPDYGGYVRYIVGIILSIVMGIYAINKIRAFIESKKKELEVSSEERAKSIKNETAEKALDNHMCPSCGKDFIAKSWEITNNSKKEKKIAGTVTNFCRYCGLELFKKCKTCNTENFAHLPYCSNCGDHLNE